MIPLINNLGLRREVGGLASSIGFWSPTETLLLNTYTGAAAAYSLRRLDGTYWGPAITVRRASDGAEQDIGFDGNDLDVTTLESFCSGTNGFVATWYDQSGNGNDATAMTNANQPKIVDAGSVVTENGKPALYFNVADESGLVVNDNGDLDSLRSYGFSYFGVAKLDVRGAVDAYQTIFSPSYSSDDGAGCPALQFYNDNDNAPNIFGAHKTWVAITDPGRVTLDDQFRESIFSIHRDASAQWGLNSSLTTRVVDSTQTVFETTGSQSWDASTGTISTIGKQSYRHVSVSSWEGTIKEILLYSSDKSAQKTSIEANINTYYGIY